MKLFKKGDAAIIAVALAAAAIIASAPGKTGAGPVAVVTVNGETVETVDLSSVKEKRIIRPETSPGVVIAAEDGKIYFESAECRDKLCIAAGKLEKSGDVAACLPAKTVIIVVGSDVDSVVY